MNKVTLTFLFLLATLAVSAQSLEKNFVIGAQLPLFNPKKDKNDSNNTNNNYDMGGYRFCINTFVQTDFYDPNRYGRLSKFSCRIDYTYLQAPQEEQKNVYNQLHQMSVLYVLGGMHKDFGLQVGAGPTFHWGDAKGITGRLLFELYAKWHKIIATMSFNLYVPKPQRKENIASDNYKLGHVLVGLAYNL